MGSGNSERKEGVRWVEFEWWWECTDSAAMGRKGAWLLGRAKYAGNVCV